MPVIRAVGLSRSSEGVTRSGLRLKMICEPRSDQHTEVAATQAVVFVSTQFDAQPRRGKAAQEPFHSGGEAPFEARFIRFRLLPDDEFGS